MKATFSPGWNKSSQPRKQRKYRYNAPDHIRSKFVAARVSKALGVSKRSLAVRTGDKVKIMRGQFKGKEGTVSRVDRQKEKVYIEGIDRIKKDGNKAQIPCHPSNVQIITLQEDKKRRKREVTNGKKSS